MKSELFPDINFEYTLDGVLSEEYSKKLEGKYFVNVEYLMDNIEELLLLRDVVIPHNLIPFNKLRSLMAKRTYEDYNRQRLITKEYGIYAWVDLFYRDLRDIDNQVEDDIRLALDIVKKYPEHKDLVIKE